MRIMTYLTLFSFLGASEFSQEKFTRHTYSTIQWSGYIWKRLLLHFHTAFIVFTWKRRFVTDILQMEIILPLCMMMLTIFGVASSLQPEQRLGSLLSMTWTTRMRIGFKSSTMKRKSLHLKSTFKTLSWPKFCVHDNQFAIQYGSLITCIWLSNSVWTSKWPSKK